MQTLIKMLWFRLTWSQSSHIFYCGYDGTHRQVSNLVLCFWLGQFDIVINDLSVFELLQELYVYYFVIKGLTLGLATYSWQFTVLLMGLDALCVLNSKIMSRWHSTKNVWSLLLQSQIRYRKVHFLGFFFIYYWHRVSLFTKICVLFKVWVIFIHMVVTPLLEYDCIK